MSQDTPSPTPPGRRFTRLPRAGADATEAEITRVKFRDSLDAIETLLGHAVMGGREAFSRDSPAYASGSMVVIRIAALFETGEFQTYLDGVPEAVVGAIKTTRNIASHSGYRSMNDDVFWTTLTVDLPPYLSAWRAAAGG